jgi:hypothetical protein
MNQSKKIKFIWNLLLNVKQRHKAMIWLSFEILGSNVMWEGSQKWKGIECLQLKLKRLWKDKKTILQPWRKSKSYDNAKIYFGQALSFIAWIFD